MVALAPNRDRVIGRPATHLRLATDDSACHAEAHRLDHSLAAHRQPRMSLAVRDLSMNGLSAITDQPVSRGEHVGISFPADNGQRSWGAVGRVVRCEPEDQGYRIAVEFDPLPAA
jgi:hypothetical protein